MLLVRCVHSAINWKVIAGRVYFANLSRDYNHYYVREDANAVWCGPWHISRFEIIEDLGDPPEVMPLAPPAPTGDLEEERLRALLRFAPAPNECRACGAPKPCKYHNHNE